MNGCGILSGLLAVGQITACHARQARRLAHAPKDSRVHHPSEEEAGDEGAEEAEPDGRNGVDVRPDQTAGAVAERLLPSVLAATQKFPSRVPRDIGNRGETTALATAWSTFALAPWLGPALAAGAPPIGLLAFDVHDVRSDLRRAGHRLVGEPLVPRRIDPRRTIQRRYVGLALRIGGDAAASKGRRWRHLGRGALREVSPLRNL
mmetsp:Transcript_94608/g.267094  ORF Transcript_94608/g.267094 Transcript_94608/m.267094 type:complete len:205 (+) Transcript_94608:22-636(+)